MTKSLGRALLLLGLAVLSACATRLVSGQGPVGEIALQNSTDSPVYAVTIARCDAMSPGLNRITETIPQGGSGRWSIDAGCWNVRAAHGYGSNSDIATFDEVEVREGSTVELTVTH